MSHDYTQRELTDILARHRSARIRAMRIFGCVCIGLGAICGAAIALMVTR